MTKTAQKYDKLATKKNTVNMSLKRRKPAIFWWFISFFHASISSTQNYIFFSKFWGGNKHFCFLRIKNKIKWLLPKIISIYEFYFILFLQLLSCMYMYLHFMRIFIYGQHGIFFQYYIITYISLYIYHICYQRWL